MQFVCKSCKRSAFVRLTRNLNSLCDDCRKERKGYLDEMSESFPCLQLGSFENKDVDFSFFDTPSPSYSAKLSLYRKTVVTGKDSCVLGKGAYGEVWLVRNKVTKELYALKVIPRADLENMKQRKNVRQEIEIQQRISHRNIVKVFEAFSDKENIYILIEYADNGNLFHYIRKHKRLSEKEAFKFFVQIACAVDFLHKNSLMHRDIKPENILIARDGTAKLCDFGCCTYYDEMVGRYLVAKG
eukprot:TRINITY_DN10192_c0_g1_i12.p1 TRINITY_DN10192_c0_g1~~TRINITY_DN10192_c0_g1_i12.p1  ORF type:complete len:242 (-),score=80.61 TRINITY_DN10192_c0_g1_i12:708-1433(-)